MKLCSGNHFICLKYSQKLILATADNKAFITVTLVVCAKYVTKMFKIEALAVKVNNYNIVLDNAFNSWAFQTLMKD